MTQVLSKTWEVVVYCPHISSQVTVTWVYPPKASNCVSMLSEDGLFRHLVPWKPIIHLLATPVKWGHILGLEGAQTRLKILPRQVGRGIWNRELLSGCYGLQKSKEHPSPGQTKAPQKSYWKWGCVICLTPLDELSHFSSHCFERKAQNSTGLQPRVGQVEERMIDLFYDNQQEKYIPYLSCVTLLYDDQLDS